jgi:hypothetical protein
MLIKRYCAGEASQATDRKKRQNPLDIAASMRHHRCMDRRDLVNLGHHVVSRRVTLGYRNRTDLACSLAFTVRTLADIELGVRKASPGTYAMLENKLAWAPGSIDTILNGGEPKGTVTDLRRPPNAPLSHTPIDVLSRASTEELLLELRRRIITLHNGHHEVGDNSDGLDAHGGWTRGGLVASARGNPVASDAEQANA